MKSTCMDCMGSGEITGTPDSNGMALSMTCMSCLGSGQK